MLLIQPHLSLRKTPGSASAPQSHDRTASTHALLMVAHACQANSSLIMVIQVQTELALGYLLSRSVPPAIPFLSPPRLVSNDSVYSNKQGQKEQA
jgi:hypothetical protein